MKNNKLNIGILIFTAITLWATIYLGLAKQRYEYESGTCFDTKTGKLYIVDYDNNKVYETDYIRGTETTRKLKKYVD